MDSNYTSFSPLPPLENLKKRDKLVSAIRDFFHAQDFYEVETPIRIPAPAPEPNIDCPPSKNAFLRASPELQMKRLLAHGADKIFQIGPCFREFERGNKHNPEFTMIEWYRSHSTANDILTDTQNLIRATFPPQITYQGIQIDLASHWEKLPVRDAFKKYASWDPALTWDEDRFDIDLTTKVEPNLSKTHPTILCDYPAPAASLARLSPHDPLVAERWELYIGGMEIGNAFTELNSGIEQRKRFNESRQKRLLQGELDYGLDESFLQDLERGLFPPSAGIAIGIDRLTMLYCNAPSIDLIRPFCPPIGLCW